MPQSIDNTQASLALTQAFVMSGVFPPRDGGAGGAFLDEIFTFAFNFAPGSPNGTLSANGQLLSIAQHTAVFSLIGTIYGGNGTTNFALPDRHHDRHRSGPRTQPGATGRARWHIERDADALRASA
jgi:hypothetical protein